MAEPEARTEVPERARRDFAVVTAAYWVLALTDGALRTLVLLHLDRIGRTPLEIVALFAAYELLGVATNLVGGRIGARFGLRLPLAAGLLLQASVCAAFWIGADALPLGLLLVGQALAGVSKDLVKTSAKTWVKLLVGEGERGRLLALVSLLTGSKNALKGVGFLLGGVLLASIGFGATCAAMAVALAASWIAVVALLEAPRGAPRARSTLLLFSRDARLNWLAAARLFLFASRDAWFVLALPLYLRSELDWSLVDVSLFLALWTIGYGIVQARAPQYLGAAPDARRLAWWGSALLVPLALVGAATSVLASPGALLVVGLALFGALFAANSALHSYFVVHFAARDRAAADVGFYYASNAVGRLLGTLVSGVGYQLFGGGADGLVACLAAAAILATVAWLIGFPLVAAERSRSAPG